MSIETKLKKYQKPYVKGEKRSPEYDKQQKRKEALKNKHQIADILIQEVPFNINPYEKEHIHHLIDMYPNFKDLHKRASNETIILSFIFYTKISNNTDIKINNYYITSKYNLTHNTFEIILCRLTLNYLREVYIIPTTPKETDHNILLKGEIK
jgi:hypothetical protein